MEVTKTAKVKILGCAGRYSTYSKSYKKLLGVYQDPATECFICEKPFKYGDKVMQIRTDHGARHVCADCADKVQEQLDKEGGDSKA
jgi:hypothetical protein